MFDLSIILTVHNKDFLLQKVLNGILANTLGNYELIVILDGCSDDSSEILDKNKQQFDNIKIFEAPNVFETKANNIGLKNSNSNYCCIIQDDMIIAEKGWDIRMLKPFLNFSDVFAVTARTAHNWKINQNSKHVNMEYNLDNCWCDILFHCDHAEKKNISRDVFAIRSSVNRGPLMLDHEVIQKLDYLDETYSPQELDDHDLCYRAYKELGKLSGCYWIGYQSEDCWGGTRVSGKVADWLYKANHKNMKILYSRHKDVIDLRHDENRILV